MHHPTDRIVHTTAFVTLVVEHCLEQEIAQWVHHMKHRSEDPSHHELMFLPRSYILLPIIKKVTTNFRTGMKKKKEVKTWKYLLFLDPLKNQNQTDFTVSRTSLVNNRQRWSKGELTLNENTK